MSKLFEKAIDAVRRLTPDEQDDIARAMLSMAAQDEDIEPVSAEHLATVLEGLAQARRGNRASARAVEAAFRRFET